MGALIAAALGLAPVLLDALAGKRAGEVAQQVTDVVKAATGSDDPAAIANLPPEKQAELQQALITIALQDRQAEMADIADARARDIALAQSGHRNIRADVMVAIVFFGLAGVLWMLWVGSFEKGGSVEGFVITVGGALLKCITDAFQFEFGSSRGSSDRARTQDALLTGATSALSNAAVSRSSADRLNEGVLAEIRKPRS